jgi:hypothetical protein
LRFAFRVPAHKVTLAGHTELGHGEMNMSYTSEIPKYCAMYEKDAQVEIRQGEGRCWSSRATVELTLSWLMTHNLRLPFNANARATANHFGYPRTSSLRHVDPQCGPACSGRARTFACGPVVVLVCDRHPRRPGFGPPLHRPLHPVCRLRGRSLISKQTEKRT